MGYDSYRCYKICQIFIYFINGSCLITYFNMILKKGLIE